MFELRGGSDTRDPCVRYILQSLGRRYFRTFANMALHPLASVPTHASSYLCFMRTRFYILIGIHSPASTDRCILFFFGKPSAMPQRRTKGGTRCSQRRGGRATFGGRGRHRARVAAANHDKAVLPPRYPFLALLQRRPVDIDLDSCYNCRL
jgi:hypothetical protein